MKLYLLFSFFIINYAIYAQVGIGTTTPNTSSMLEVQSDSKGILIPRMTKNERNNIASPSIGLLVFQTDNPIGFYYYNNVKWVKLGDTQDNKYYPGSTILSQPQETNLNTLYGIATQVWKKCYRASTDGFSSLTFHANCNNKGASMSIFKLSNGFIFGGYNPSSWTLTNGYSGNNTAFIFSVTNNVKFSGNANFVYNNSNYGPTFGGGHDIYTKVTMQIGYMNPFSYNYLGFTDNQVRMILAGTTNFNLTGVTVTELEVWVLN